METIEKKNKRIFYATIPLKITESTTFDLSHGLMQPRWSVVAKAMKIMESEQSKNRTLTNAYLKGLGLDEYVHSCYCSLANLMSEGCTCGGK